MDLAVPVNHRVKNKRKEKIDKYFDFTKKLL